MKLLLRLVILGSALSACAQVEGLFDPRTPAPPVQAPAEGQTRPVERPAAGLPRPTAARTADALDATSDSERAAAVDKARQTGGAVDLGTTIASLGAVTEPGIWLKTPLVDAPAPGRVDYAAQGTSVAVELRPLDTQPGAGSRISLAAMRLIGADLTDLPELRVFRLPD